MQKYFSLGFRNEAQFIGVDFFSVLYPQIPIPPRLAKCHCRGKFCFQDTIGKRMVPCETEILLKKFNLTKIHGQKFELHEISPISRTSDM